MRTPPDAEHLPALSSCVWRERHLVERLLYTAVAARLLLLAGERRFIGWTLQELETVVAALRVAEGERAGVMAEVALAWGVAPTELTLARISREAAEPWASIFADHHHSLSTLMAEVEATAADSHRLRTERRPADERPRVGLLRGITLAPAQRLLVDDAVAGDHLDELTYEATAAVLDHALPRGLVTAVG